MACRRQVLFTMLLLSAATLLSAPSAMAVPRKLMKNKIPTFQVYNVLAIQGANSTQGYNTVRCGGSTARSEAPIQFGDIFCFDMPLLKKKDVNSELLGRVQGTYTVSQLTGNRVFVTETFIVNGTSLPYKGSFSAIGIEDIGVLSSKPITGGTGDYELVSGDAFTTPVDGVSIDEFGNAVFWFLYQFIFA